MIYGNLNMNFRNENNGTMEMLKYKFLKQRKSANFYLWLLTLIIISVFFLVIGVFPVSAAGETDLSCKGCNVLFLNIELLRADHVGLLNPEKRITPNIDKFFENSIIFEQATSSAANTYQSSTATFTATDAIINKHTNFINRPKEGKLLIDYFPTVAEVLFENGYNTVDYNDGKRSGKLVGLDRGFSVYKDLDMRLFDKQSNVLKSLLNKKPMDPFFVYFHSNSLHYPYDYPLSKIKSVSPYSKINASADLVTINFKIPLERKTQVLKGPFERNEYNNLMYKVSVDGKDMNFTYDDFDNVRQVYDNQVKYIDEELKKIFNLLRQDLVNNTIIILYANHGDGLFNNGVPSHGVVYQSLVHVPLLIRHPKLKEQIRIETPVSLIDLAPTIYDMLDIEIRHDISGYSLVPLIMNESYQREYIFGKGGQTKYIRKGDWKLIVTGTKLKELFYLKEDPYEEVNLIDEYPEIARDLEAALLNKEIESLKFAKHMRRYFGLDTDYKIGKKIVTKTIKNSKTKVREVFYNILNIFGG